MNGMQLEKNIGKGEFSHLLLRLAVGTVISRMEQHVV
jgi:hypothetical protein